MLAYFNEDSLKPQSPDYGRSIRLEFRNTNIYACVVQSFVDKTAPKIRYTNSSA